MLNFIKPTKLKLALLVLIWITLLASAKIAKIVRPVAFDTSFPKVTDHLEEAKASLLGECKEELEKILEETDGLIRSEPKIVIKVGYFTLITLLSQIPLCYLCACIIVFITKKNLTKDIPRT